MKISEILKETHYVGTCDRFRLGGGEDFWQEMIKNSKEISEEVFLSKVDVNELPLDEDETWEEYINNLRAQDDVHFFDSSNALFFETAGFEFIWKK